MAPDYVQDYVAAHEAAHLRHMIESGEDLEKTLVTLSGADLDRAIGVSQPV